ncbi:hypothetical protein BJX63DRAFT_432453 [Aspergillus granulosus]|uniref:Uncharacterized protein n=1 Tax=Aspergillus granulosus TaxID=176169 RepID=A0ABR4HBF2_9EURO
MIATGKTLLLAAALSTGALGAVQATFNRYFDAGCTTALGAVTVAEGFCVNVGNFPIQSWDAHVASGACEDASTSPVIKFYTDSGCEAGQIGDFAIETEAQCVAQEVTVQSVTLVCE